MTGSPAGDDWPDASTAQEISECFRDHGVQDGVALLPTPGGDEAVFLVSPTAAARLREASLVAALTQRLRRKVWITSDASTWPERPVLLASIVARGRFLSRIRSGVASAGHHVTLVRGGRVPRYAYTIGLTERGLPELVLAGATSLSAAEVKRALDAAAAGEPGLRVTPVHSSWTRRLLLGALDYYGRDDVPALQLAPEGADRTIDVPDLSRPWDAAREPVWRWLPEGSWTLPVSPDAVAVTNLDALRGAPVTEAARWEETEWEVFAGAGPDVLPEEVRTVPLATLLGFDDSLLPLTELAVGSALRREPPGPWQPWGP